MPDQTIYQQPRRTGRAGETEVTSTCGHNCGGRCVVNAHVVDDRIVKISTDPARIDAAGVQRFAAAIVEHARLGRGDMSDDVIGNEAKMYITMARIGAIATDNGLTALPSATNFVTVDCGRDGAFGSQRLMASTVRDDSS